MFTPLLAHAQNSDDVLTVHLTNGTHVTYILDDKPKVSFSEGLLNVNSQSVSDTHDMTVVERFTFGKSTGLDALKSDDKVISFHGDDLTLKGFATGSKVVVSDLQGRIITSVKVDANGNATVPTFDWTKGIYVVSTSDGKTLKIIK